MSDESDRRDDGLAGDDAGQPQVTAAPGDQRKPVEWDPDGVDLAKALVARAKAAGRSGGRKGGTARRRTSGGRSRTSAGTGWSGPGGDERDPQPLSAAVGKLADEHGWEEDLSVHGVMARWDELVGSEVAAHVRPESYDDSILTVRADSTAWATQVRLLAAELVRKINQRIGHGTVTKVNVLGPQSRSWSKGRRSVPGRGPRDTYG
jgi:predicted nucleic acid-binding Zn ribbon protein